MNESLLPTINDTLCPTCGAYWDCDCAVVSMNADGEDTYGVGARVINQNMGEHIRMEKPDA